MRRAGKPVILIANKAEGRAGRRRAPTKPSASASASRSPFSAEHGEGLGELYDALAAALPPRRACDAGRRGRRPRRSRSARRRTAAKPIPTKPLRIAVLGRPNAGKSTLLNRILGEERLLTGPEPGMTRDSIGLETDWRGRELKLFDTAGLRRRSRVVEKLEKLAVADALRAVRFAEVVVLLLDATIPFEKQDLTLADLVEREGRALVIGLNKWDLVDNKSAKAQELRAEADRLLPQLRGTRVIPVSGLDRRACRQAAWRRWSRPTKCGTCASRPGGSTAGWRRSSTRRRRPPSPAAG